MNRLLWHVNELQGYKNKFVEVKSMTSVQVVKVFLNGEVVDI